MLYQTTALDRYGALRELETDEKRRSDKQKALWRFHVLRVSIDKLFTSSWQDMMSDGAIYPNQ